REYWNFYGALASATGNAVLIHLTAALQRIVDSKLAAREYTPERLVHSSAVHRRILDAVADPAMHGARVHEALRGVLARCELAVDDPLQRGCQMDQNGVPGRGSERSVEVPVLT